MIFCKEERDQTNLKYPVLNPTAHNLQKFVPAFLAVILVVLGWLSFYQTFSYPFVHDDLVFIRDNPDIARLDGWREIFNPLPSSQGIVNAYYRPGLELLSRIQYVFFRLDAGAYHGFNVILHILNGLLLFYVLTEILSGYGEAWGTARRQERGLPGTGRLPVIPLSLGLAWSVAVVFVIHPVQTEAVACVSGVSNLLLVFLCLLCFILFLRLIEKRRLRRVTRWGVVLFLGGFFTAALFVKEQAVVLPVLFFAYLLTIGRARQQSSRFSLAVPALLLVVVAGYFYYRKILLGHPVTPFLGYNYELVLRLKAIPRTLLVYFQILFFPVGLHYYRSLDVLAPNAAGTVLLALVLAAMTAGDRALPAALRPYYRFGLLWFAVTLSPMLNILPLIHEYSYIALFEHFLYWPLPGIFLSFFVFVTYIFERRLPRKSPSPARQGILLGVILVLTVMTLRQNTVWRGEIPLFERAVAYERNLARVRILLGKAYYFNGQPEKALPQLNQALSILEGYLQRVRDAGARGVYLSFKKEALFSAAQCLEAMGRWPQAIQYYKAALQIDPNDSMILNNLGAVFLQRHRIEEAERWFAAAVTADKTDLMAKTNLALCYIFLGKGTQAEEALREVLSVDPNFSPARHNWDILTNNPEHRVSSPGSSRPAIPEP